MQQKLATIAMISVGLLLGACKQARPVELPTEPSMSGSIVESDTAPDSPNERTPTTMDSLEIEMSTGATITTHMTASGTILTGDPLAPHRLMIFSDYDCTYCRRFSTTDLPWIEQETISGRLAIEHVFVPMSKNGESAARLAACSAEQGKFSEVHHRLSTKSISAIDIEKFAKGVGVNLKKLLACTAQSNLLSGHLQKAQEFDVERVPYFVLGKDSWLGLLQKEELREKIGKVVNE